MNIEMDLYNSSEIIIKAMRPFGRFIEELGFLGTPYSTAIEMAAKKFPECKTFFKIHPKNGIQIKNEYLFADYKINEIKLSNSKTRKEWILPYSLKNKKLVDAVVAMNLGNPQSLSQIESLPAELKSKFLSFLNVETSTKSLIENANPKKYSRPGIYRFQHACCMIRTKKAGVLIDPTFQWVRPDFETQLFKARDIVPNVDAIMLTHAHCDHFHVGTLMHFPKDMPILVPEKKPSSLASPCMPSLLKSLGFTNVMPLPWNSEFKVKDINIKVLSYYGEQVTATEKIYKGLYNWGNTYLIQTPNGNIWPLADTGQDLQGSMVQVAEQLKAEGAKIHGILGGMRECEMRSAWAVGGLRRWLCMSPKQRLGIYHKNGVQGEANALGLKGVIAVIDQLRPDWFLPYNHGFFKLGDVKPFEKTNVKNLKKELKKRKITTKVYTWTIGDYLSLP